MKLHLKAMECHLSYGITQCYLPSNTGEHIPPNLRQRGRYLIYLPHPVGMEGWVDLGDQLHTEMVYYRQTVIHPSTNLAVHSQESNLLITSPTP